MDRKNLITYLAIALELDFRILDALMPHLHTKDTVCEFVYNEVMERKENVVLRKDWFLRQSKGGFQFEITSPEGNMVKFYWFDEPFIEYEPVSVGVFVFEIKEQLAQMKLE